MVDVPTPLTADQIVRIRRFVGDEPADDVLAATWATGRNTTLTGITLEILEIRKANLLASPLQFAITGEYTQNARFNVQYITDLITGLRAGTISPDTDDPTVDLGSVRLVPPAVIRR